MIGFLKFEDIAIDHVYSKIEEHQPIYWITGKAIHNRTNITRFFGLTHTKPIFDDVAKSEAKKMAIFSIDMELEDAYLKKGCMK